MGEAIFIPGFEDGFDKNLRFQIDSVPEIPRSLVIFLKGSIDNYNATFFSEKMESVLSSRYVNIVFKCALLEYVSSSGIGVFTKFYSTLKERGGNLVFMDLQPKVLEVFQLLGFNSFFNIKATMAETIDFFKEPKNTATSVFPFSFGCPMCSAKLRAFHPGNFRCSKCKAIFQVDSDGKIKL